MKEINELKDLQGLKVNYNWEQDEEPIPCIIIEAYIEDFYFWEKNESMNVYCLLSPIDKTLIESLGFEEFTDVSLEKIKSL